MKTFVASCALLVLLVGCDESAGDPGSAPIRDQQQCRASGLTIGVDQKLPLGFSVRELIDSLPDEARTPGALWPAAEVASAEQGAGWGARPETSTSVLLRPEVREVDRVDVYEGICPWKSEFAISGTLEIVADDGSIGRTVHGFFSGAPGRVFFNEPRSPVVRSHLCSTAVQVAFLDDSLPLGVICDGAGNVMSFPSTCSGPPSPLPGWRLGPTPREELERLGMHGPLSVAWLDGSRSELTLELELVPDGVCYGGVDWVAQVRVRASAPSAGLMIDEIVELRASGYWEESQTINRSIGAACERVEADNSVLRELAGLGSAPGLMCIGLEAMATDRFEGALSWIGAQDEDAGVGGETRFPIEESSL